MRARPQQKQNSEIRRMPYSTPGWTNMQSRILAWLATCEHRAGGHCSDGPDDDQLGVGAHHYGRVEQVQALVDLHGAQTKAGAHSKQGGDHAGRLSVTDLVLPDLVLRGARLGYARSITGLSGRNPQLTTVI